MLMEPKTWRLNDLQDHIASHIPGQQPTRNFLRLADGIASRVLPSIRDWWNRTTRSGTPGRPKTRVIEQGGCGSGRGGTGEVEEGECGRQGRFEERRQKNTYVYEQEVMQIMAKAQLQSLQSERELMGILFETYVVKADSEEVKDVDDEGRKYHEQTKNKQEHRLGPPRV